MMAFKKYKADRSLAFFKGLTLFANIDVAEVGSFIDAGKATFYKKGRLLYAEGNVAPHFYIICNGWVKQFSTTAEGEEISLAMLTEDNILGENAIFEEGRYRSSARVVEDAEILSLPIALLKQQLRSNTTLAFNLMTAMVKNQRRRETMQAEFLLYSAPQRIGCFLLALCPVQKQKDGVILTLPYDKALIASTLSMKGATFSRALNILREETGIHITGTRVTIGSIARLLNFVDGCYSLDIKRQDLRIVP